MRLGARIGFAAITWLAALSAYAGDVAIIVHPDNPQDAVASVDLTRLFRLEQRWKSGDKVDLVLQVSGSAKEAIILDRVFHMKGEDLDSFWMGKIFRQEISEPPRSFASDASVLQYVAKHPRALGYIDAALLDASVKAVRLDGKRPGEEGYPLARAR